MNLKKILILVAVLGIAISCRDEEAVRFPEFQKGVNARVILYPERSFINFDDLTTASVAFDIYSENTDIDEIAYTATFVDADSAEAVFPSFEAFRVPGSAFVNGKVTELEITAAELAEKFGLPGGVSYFEGADNVTFTAKAILTDGREIDFTNSAPSITGGAAASFTPAFRVYVGCPSNVAAIAGNYESTMHYNNFDIGVGGKVDVTVTFVGPEPFRYRVTDHTAGLYVPFGGTKYPADFYDICGTIVMLPASSFGSVVNFQTTDPNFLPPVLNTSTNQTEFVLNWNETFNGILASVKFVKKI